MNADLRERLGNDRAAGPSSSIIACRAVLVGNALRLQNVKLD
jgi:hypothetical protein